jgi:hypothetical protein
VGEERKVLGPGVCALGSLPVCALGLHPASAGCHWIAIYLSSVSSNPSPLNWRKKHLPHSISRRKCVPVNTSHCTGHLKKLKGNSFFLFPNKRFHKLQILSPGTYLDL